MKQKANPQRRPSRSRDFYHDLSLTQLSTIGAIALAWNDIEHLLNWVLNACLAYDDNINLEITSRLHGFVGRLAIIKSFAENYYDFPEDVRNLFNNTMSLVGEGKAARDAIIHTRLYNAKDAIGETIESRGAKSHVLISEDALNAVYKRLLHAWDELSLVYQYFSAATAHFMVNSPWADEEKQSHALELLEYVSLLQSHQRKRRSLPRFPKFPVLPEALPK